MLLDKRISLFSPQAIGERHHRDLLVQFILYEVFEAYKAHSREESWDAVLSCHPRHFPYDWSLPTGHLNKAHEHSLLLEESFPDRCKEVKKFEKQFAGVIDLLAKKKVSREHFIEALRKIYETIEPFIEICRENENLLHFLLKNRETIDTLAGHGHLHAFLLRTYASDLESLGEKMCDQYHQRGFFSQIPEFKFLLTELSHA
jgi:hypothetical protein